jgi:DNA excision repair protein ERCC-2
VKGKEMPTKPLIKISVRNLIEYVLMGGNLSSGFISNTRMTDGIKGHQKIQKSRPEGYLFEVPVTFLVENEKIELEISGRIDGILINENETIIEEIKTTSRDLNDIDSDSNLSYWAQAKCYAFIYATQNKLSSISIQLTYFNTQNDEMKFFNEYFDINELKTFFYDLIDKYIIWAVTIQNWTNFRNASIKQISFPFNNYRRGQRELAVTAYRAIRDGRKLFAQAPTGIGKTIATLFPAIKAIGEGHASKIFYLTAKTITRTIAEKALESLRRSGLSIKSVTITAKDKICFNPQLSNCDPEFCEYARGYYDRVKDAISDIFHLDSFTRPAIEEYAYKHRICPFEFTLDLSLNSDCIICDYNYVFDPKVYLKRFFMDQKEEFIFLIDEAHNLVDRSREMFSAELTKREILDLKKAVKKELPKLSPILNKINTCFIDVRKSIEKSEKSNIVQKEKPIDILELVKKFINISEAWLSKNEPGPFREALLDLYFKTLSFINISDSYSERYVTYFEKVPDDIKVKLFCLDPSYILAEAMKRGKAIILFSATLTPMNYFTKILGGDEASVSLKLPSPFERNNLCLLLDDKTSTKYRMRENTYDSITLSLISVIKGKVGNYLVYFPSYKYMNEIYNRFCALETGVDVILQKDGMTESDREGFLNEFSDSKNKSLLGFAVMGGIFGEGIDLVGERLSGAIIVGVGLPQICLERDIIRDYFNDINEQGYEYAYVYPGMNKVLQAVGRVIRTETDLGAVLLIDERFSTALYRDLCPQEWHPILKVSNVNDIEAKIKDFWEKSY